MLKVFWQRKSGLNVRGNPGSHIMLCEDKFKSGVLLLCPNFGALLTLLELERAWQRAERVVFEVGHVVFAHSQIAAPLT